MLAIVSQSNLNAFNDNAQYSIDQIQKRAIIIELARSAHVEFKTQIQEWKNTLLRGQNIQDFTKYKKALEERNATVDTKLNKLKTLLRQLNKPTTEIDALLASHAIVQQAYLQAIQKYDSNNINSVLQIDANVRGIDRQTGTDFDALVELLQTDLNQYITQTKSSSNLMLVYTNTSIYIALAFILTPLIILFTLTLTGILKPLRYATDTLIGISKGNYLLRIDNQTTNEIGTMIEAMRAMSIRLGLQMAEENKVANDSLRLQIGLDNVDTGVMIADRDRKIVYLNKSIKNLFKEAQADICRELPHFNVDDLMGTSIDVFHKDPAHQMQLLNNLNETTQIKVVVGNRHMFLKASPIINEFGQRLGSVAEWTDHTVEVNLENEISSVVSDAVQGRFANRLDLTNKKDFFLQLSAELNKLLDVCDRGFGDIRRVLSAIAQGDLTEKITNQYDGEFHNLKNDTNRAVEQLNEVVKQIKSTNEIIDRGISEISQGNNDLAKRTESQVISLQNAATAIHELTTNVIQNDKNANYANDAVNSVFEVVDKGVKMIEKVVKTMEIIHESSLKVVDITGVIDSIAFQTNILALNAAVEAARAGEQGRGFAVVATEVQSLAQRASKAAGEIKDLINDSEEKVEDGSNLVVDAGKIMKEIARSIEGVTTMMASIATSCSEQSQGIEQINATITDTENMTQQNSSLVIEAANSTDSLEKQIKMLSNAIDYFTIETLP
jgi:methyl-accepting chemotaxis protein